MKLFGFVCAILFWLGVIRMQIRWRTQGKLNEASFALFQVAALGLLILAGFLLFSNTWQVMVGGIVLSTLSMTFGLPVARWIYRQFEPHK